MYITTPHFTPEQPGFNGFIIALSYSREVQSGAKVRKKTE
jgi:hypothetical protein